MSPVIDGSWVITLAVVEPGNTATIPVTLDPFGATEPKWDYADGAMAFWWKDGQTVIYPFAAMLRAEYTPPVRTDANQRGESS